MLFIAGITENNAQYNGHFQCRVIAIFKVHKVHGIR